MKLYLLIFVAILMLLYSTKDQEKNMNEIFKTTEFNSTKRVGMVIKIKPEYIEEYKKLHAEGNQGVRDLLAKYHMHNFSIFIQKLDDGNYYEFGYYEYTGTNFKQDMELLAAEPRNIEWLSICDPMQIPLSGYSGWAEMEQVYFNE